ncbi:hypothetical protein B0H14DRAFT_3521701 [Mycena olivaceomarginata]|nr:hypothetical protein B0H14DRAFT_3521701 [Mycena olivaceomarginata]
MSPLRSRSPTAPSDHENVLDTPMEGSNILEGTPPRSMYIDDQAEEDTDSEMDESEGDYDDEDSMEARVRRDEESTFMRANLAEAHEQWLKGGPRPRIPTPPPFRWLADRASPTPPAQDMEVEQEGETLAGGPSNSKLASELFPQDEDSDPETEQYLPPPSSSTKVATVIRARIRRYFDDQAEDSDEDADEEREEEEQEMEEDRDFVDDTAVDEDFVHRLPSNRDDAREVEKWVAHFQNEDKIAHYKRDVAREAAGEAGAPSAEQKQMLSPRELILYNKAKHLRTDMQVAQFECALHWEMLADVDVELHTWVRAPIQFDCRVGFVLTVTDLVVIQDGEAKVRLEPHGMSQRWFPKVEPTFAEIALFADSRLKRLSRVVLAKPSPPLDAGDRVVVMTGDRKGSTGRIMGVADIRIAGKWVAMAQVLPPSPDPYPKGKGPLKPPEEPRPFEVGLAQLKRHALDLYYDFRIHDRVRVVSGALYVGAIGRVEKVEGHFLTLAVPKDCEVVGATWSSPTSDSTKLFIISIVHVTRQWAIGDSVRVTRGHSGDLELLEANVGYSRYQDVPHSRTVRCSDVDFEHELWTTMATTRLPSASWSESNSDIDLTVGSTLPFSQPLERFYSTVEEAKGRGRGEGHIDIPHKGFIGMIIGDFDSRERSDRLKNGVEPDHKRHTGKLLRPVDSTRLRNPDVAGDNGYASGTMVSLVEARFFPPDILFGTRPLEPSPNPRAVTYRGPFRSDTETAPPPRSTTPIPANAAVWGSHPPVEGENNGRWLCQPELVGRRLDVQILGIATLANNNGFESPAHIGRKLWLGPTFRAGDHKDAQDPSRRVMKANIEEAKNAAAADPTNRSKALEYQYLERFEFGVYEADAAVNRYIAARTRREFVMDQLRHAAVSCCPFDSGGSLEEYYDAAAAFHRDFGRAYQAEDGLDDVLATKRKLRRIYKGLMLLETEEQAELVAQETYRFSVKNPFPAHDPRRMRVDTKLRELLALCNEWSPKKLPSTLQRRDAYSSPAQHVECGPAEQGLHQAWPPQCLTLADGCPSTSLDSPDVLLYNGRTLVQPRMPALLAQYGLTEPRQDGRAPPPVSVEDRAAQEFADEASSEPDIMWSDPTPTPDKTKHRRARAKQWERWQGEILPALLPEFGRVLQETKSLRDLEGRRQQTPSCHCLVKIHNISIVRFSCIEDLELQFCSCAPVAVQLMRLGAFA